MGCFVLVPPSGRVSSRGAFEVSLKVSSALQLVLLEGQSTRALLQTLVSLAEGGRTPRHREPASPGGLWELKPPIEERAQETGTTLPQQSKWRACLARPGRETWISSPGKPRVPHEAQGNWGELPLDSKMRPPLQSADQSVARTGTWAGWHPRLRRPLTRALSGLSFSVKQQQEGCRRRQTHPGPRHREEEEVEKPEGQLMQVSHLRHLWPAAEKQLWGENQSSKQLPIPAAIKPAGSWSTPPSPWQASPFTLGKLPPKGQQMQECNIGWPSPLAPSPPGHPHPHPSPTPDPQVNISTEQVGELFFLFLLTLPKLVLPQEELPVQFTPGEAKSNSSLSHILTPAQAHNLEGCLQF
ncbi:hypothetical protein E2320_013170 [Naja naja]|nr:hypothetical protein E2320_013170 [Naja naja]